MAHRFLIAAMLALLTPLAALGQSVQQSGSITPSHVPYWVSNGVIGDSGTASDSRINSFGVTSNSSAGLCVASGRASAAGRQLLCMGTPLASAAVISLQNYGTATAQDLKFIINGTEVVIPTGGSGFVQYTGTLVSGDLPCWSGTSGVVADCGYAITGGGANKIPYWASSSSMSAMSAAASSVLVTSSGSVPSLSQTLPQAVQTNITSVGTVTTGVWAATPITVAGGGTGTNTLAAHGALIGDGTSAVASVTTSQIGFCLLSQGSSSDPIWASCASGTGTAGGSDTQVQFNNATNLAGNANLTWVSPALTIGQNATTTGQLKLANGGAVGVSVTVQNPSATTAYNFNLPTAAGTSGQPLLSGGGGSTAQSYGTLQVTAGGTGCSAAAGTCLDNITNFSSTGYMNRTGSGTYAFSSVIPLSSGGTNASLTGSNGGIFYSTATAGAILSGTATANQVLLSGSSTTPAWSTAVYPATTTVSQILYSSSANTIAGLATANSGVLITSAGGVPSISSTLPSAVQANITATGTVASGTWNGSVIGLTYGGTNAALTASNGGIHYSTATATAILSGTATASLPMLSGATAAPTWAAISYPTSATSGGIPYFSSATAIASSLALGANQIVIGGGAGTAPSTFACATATTVVHGGTPPTCSQIVAADITTNTVTNANLAQVAAVTLKGNPTSSTANASDFTLAGLTSRGAPDATNDLMLLWDSAAGTLKKVTPGAVASSATAGVSSIAGNTGAFTLDGGVTNLTNAIVSTQTVNAQTGTSYAILDGDRGKVISASNAAAQAYSIAQAGAASSFLSGWSTHVYNKSTNVAGIVTITPTTSTINGAATLKIQPGQSAVVTSDGTNYLASFLGSAAQLPGTTTNDSANAGNLGEYVENNASGVTISPSATQVNVTSISLTAGDWTACGSVGSTSSGASATYLQAGITTVSATIPTFAAAAGAYVLTGSATAGQNVSASTGCRRLLLSGTTTVYLAGTVGFTGSGMAIDGYIWARRAR